jgi:SPP1 gp7 family putative phage head morphogenesis protein
MSNYWRDRMAQSQNKLTNKNIKQIEKQIRKYYQSATKQVIADFEATYDKLLASVADGKQPTPADLYKLDKYWQAQAQMRAKMQALGNRQITAMSKIFEINFFDVYYSISLEGLQAFNTIDTAGARQLINAIWCADGKSFSQRIWENTQRLIDTLNDGLINCVLTGKKTSDLKKVLQERFNVSYSRADTLVRTELAHVQTLAAQQRYKDYGIEQMEFWADEDERRCPDCGKLHMKLYPTNGPMPVPVHPNCRCCMIPVVDID